MSENAGEGKYISKENEEPIFSSASEFSDYANTYHALLYTLTAKLSSENAKPTLAELKKALKVTPIETVDQWFNKKSEDEKKFWNKAERATSDKVKRLNELAVEANKCKSVNRFSEIWTEMLTLIYGENHPIRKPW